MCGQVGPGVGPGDAGPSLGVSGAVEKARDGVFDGGAAQLGEGGVGAVGLLPGDELGAGLVGVERGTGVCGPFKAARCDGRHGAHAPHFLGGGIDDTDVVARMAGPLGHLDGLFGGHRPAEGQQDAPARSSGLGGHLGVVKGGGVGGVGVGSPPALQGAGRGGGLVDVFHHEPVHVDDPGGGLPGGLDRVVEHHPGVVAVAGEGPAGEAGLGLVDACGGRPQRRGAETKQQARPVEGDVSALGGPAGGGGEQGEADVLEVDEQCRVDAVVHQRFFVEGVECGEVGHRDDLGGLGLVGQDGHHLFLGEVLVDVGHVEGGAPGRALPPRARLFDIEHHDVFFDLLALPGR